MLASEYAAKYLHLAAVFSKDEVSEVAIDKYLNAGIKGQGDKKPHPMDYRANRADAEREALLGKVKDELKIVGRMPATFQLDGYAFKLMDVVNPFFGKGSPSDVMDVLWLASRYKRVTPATARDYSTKYLGLDCNGFASNYWGMSNPGNREITQFDVNRRKDVADVAAGDALVFYHAGTTTDPFHLAVLDRVVEKATEGTLRFHLTESAGWEGLERGVSTEFKDWKLTKNAKQEVVADLKAEGWLVQFAEGPPKQTPRGMYWSVSSD